MMVALKIYRDCENPFGLPEQWPAETREIGNDDPLPLGFAGKLTRDEYEAYIGAFQHLYDEWEAKGTEAQRRDRVLVADENAWAYIYRWHDEGGLIKIGDWKRDPATPPLALIRIKAVSDWIDLIMGYYLTVAKPAILTGAWLPVLDDPSGYEFLGPCPYSFTQIFNAAAGIEQ